MQDFDELNRDDQLRADNDFMKMKMMLESGAEFYCGEDGVQLPPEVENQFLKQIMQFEEQFSQQRMVKVADKIGNPVHFKPVNEIPDDKMDRAWDELSGYMNRFGINLSATNKNISSRELYRYATEELFESEVIDMNIPGMMQRFLYEDVRQTAEEECRYIAEDLLIKKLLSSRPYQWGFHPGLQDLFINQHRNLCVDEFLKIFHRVQAAYDRFDEPAIDGVNCLVNETTAMVSGFYKVLAYSGRERIMLGGKWKVHLGISDDRGLWDIRGVEIEGIFF